MFWREFNYRVNTKQNYLFIYDSSHLCKVLKYPFQTWKSDPRSKFTKETVLAATELLKKVTLVMVQQKCKKANNKNMVLNLSILQEKEEKVKSISQRNRRIQSISESEAENLEGEISDALAEVEKTEKGSKSVMLYTTIVFSIALAVRQVLFSD